MHIVYDFAKTHNLKVIFNIRRDFCICTLESVDAIISMEKLEVVLNKFSIV